MTRAARWTRSRVESDDGRRSPIHCGRPDRDGRNRAWGPLMDAEFRMVAEACWAKGAIAWAIR